MIDTYLKYFKTYRYSFISQFFISLSLVLGLLIAVTHQELSMIFSFDLFEGGK